MRLLKKIAFVLISIALISCSKQSIQVEEDKSDPISDLAPTPENIVVQERNPDYALIDYKAKRDKIRVGTKANKLTLADYIGMSFKLDYYPYEDVANIGFYVLDIDKFNKDYPRQYTITSGINKSYTRYDAFAGFERYDKVVSKTKTVNGGFGIDFKIFHIGAKGKYTSTFKCTDTQISDNVFGELDIMYHNSEYNMRLPQYIRKNLKKYLCQSFIDELYYLSHDEFIDIYGGFLLHHFYSGGHALALYSGEYSEKIHDEGKKKEAELTLEGSMKKSVNVSNKEGSGDSGDANGITGANVDVTIGKTTDNGSTYTNKFNKVEFAMATYGGLPSFSGFSVPKDLNTSSFNISSWCQSIASESNLTIVSLPDGALIPLTEFIEEDNLKEALYDYYEKGASGVIKPMQEPYVEIYEAYTGGRRFVVMADLHTRYGEIIQLRRSAGLVPAIFVDSFISKVYSEISNLFDGIRFEIRFIEAPGEKEIGSYQPSDKLLPGCFGKYIDSSNGKIYILCEDESNKNLVAYTIYNEEILNEYRLAKYVDSLPLSDITLDEIRRDYHLIAL